MLSKEKLDRMLVLAREGMPTNWIAEDVGLSADTVRKHVCKNPDYRREIRGWSSVWPKIRKSSKLMGLHREFAPRPSR